MTQYLLSVYMIDGQEPPSDEETQKMYADVGAVNEEIKEAGAWVFANGLHPASTATVEGPAAGLEAIEDLELEAYHPYHSVRADLLGRLGREDEARDVYETAIALTDNEAERDSLRRQRERLAGSR